MCFDFYIIVSHHLVLNPVLPNALYTTLLHLLIDSAMFSDCPIFVFKLPEDTLAYVAHYTVDEMIYCIFTIKHHLHTIPIKQSIRRKQH